MVHSTMSDRDPGVAEAPPSEPCELPGRLSTVAGRPGGRPAVITDGLTKRFGDRSRSTGSRSSCRLGW